MQSEPWFSKHPDIAQIYELFGYNQLVNPIRYNHTSVPFCLQEGPQCGLVALAMIMGNVTKEAVNDLFQCAKEANFTYNGEMLSVQDMAQLAKMKLKSSKIEVYNGDLNCDIIKEFLLSGGLMLVPYDTSKNFAPSNENGHQAHWAAVTGCVECEDHSFYVVARQGKSKFVSIWNLEILAESNKQLNEFSPQRQLSTNVYKLPEGGIGGPNGLKSQSVLIYANHFKSA